MAAVCCLLKWSNADLNAADLAYSRWVAVSKENIYIVRRKRKGDMRCSCCDMAEMRKTIPINNVQDIMITEPAAYAVCDCCVANVLTSIKVETAGNAGDGGINDPSVGLLMGMTDPQRFRTVVLNLKRGVYTCSPPASPRRLRRRPRWTRSAGRLARQVCPPSVPRSPAAPPREASTRSRPPRPRAAPLEGRGAARLDAHHVAEHRPEAELRQGHDLGLGGGLRTRPGRGPFAEMRPASRGQQRHTDVRGKGPPGAPPPGVCVKKVVCISNGVIAVPHIL